MSDVGIPNMTGLVVALALGIAALPLAVGAIPYRPVPVLAAVLILWWYEADRSLPTRSAAVAMFCSLLAGYVIWRRLAVSKLVRFGVSVVVVVVVAGLLYARLLFN